MSAVAPLLPLIEYERGIHEREQELREKKISLKELLAWLLSIGGVPLFARIIDHATCKVVTVFDEEVDLTTHQDRPLTKLFEKLFGSPFTNIRFTPGTSDHKFIEDGDIHSDDKAAIRTFERICRSVVRRVEPVDELFGLRDFVGTFVCAGGPISNSLSRIVMQYEQRDDNPENGLTRVPEPVFKLGYEYLLDPNDVPPNSGDVTWSTESEKYHIPNWSIRDVKNNKILVPELDEDQGLRTDFLLISVLRNILDKSSYNHGRKIIIFGGTHGAGTRAIDLLCRDFSLLRGICDYFERTRYGQALIKVNSIKLSQEGCFIPLSLSQDIQLCPIQIDDSARDKWLCNIPSLSDVRKVGMPVRYSLASTVVASAARNRRTGDIQPTETALRDSVERSAELVSLPEEIATMTDPVHEEAERSYAAYLHCRSLDQAFLREHPEFEGFLTDLRSVYIGHRIRTIHGPVDPDSVTAQQAYDHIFGTRCLPCRAELDESISTMIRPFSPGDWKTRGEKILTDIAYSHDEWEKTLA